MRSTAVGSLDALAARRVRSISQPWSDGEQRFGSKRARSSRPSMRVAEKGFGEGMVHECRRRQMGVIEFGRKVAEFVVLRRRAGRSRPTYIATSAMISHAVGPDTTLRRRQRHVGVSRARSSSPSICCGPGNQRVRSECRKPRDPGEECACPVLGLVPERPVGEQVQRGVQRVGERWVVQCAHRCAARSSGMMSSRSLPPGVFIGAAEGGGRRRQPPRRSGVRVDADLVGSARGFEVGSPTIERSAASCTGRTVALRSAASSERSARSASCTTVAEPVPSTIAASSTVTAPANTQQSSNTCRRSSGRSPTDQPPASPGSGGGGRSIDATPAAPARRRRARRRCRRRSSSPAEQLPSRSSAGVDRAWRASHPVARGRCHRCSQVRRAALARCGEQVQRCRRVERRNLVDPLAC